MSSTLGDLRIGDKLYAWVPNAKDELEVYLVIEKTMFPTTRRAPKGTQEVRITLFDSNGHLDRLCGMAYETINDASVSAVFRRQLWISAHVRTSRDVSNIDDIIEVAEGRLRNQIALNPDMKRFQLMEANDE